MHRLFGQRCVHIEFISIKMNHRKNWSNGKACIMSFLSSGRKLQCEIVQGDFCRCVFCSATICFYSKAFRLCISVINLLTLKYRVETLSKSMRLLFSIRSVCVNANSLKLISNKPPKCNNKLQLKISSSILVYKLTVKRQLAQQTAAHDPTQYRRMVRSFSLKNNA